ncbi:MAG: hypothetical protein JWM67_613 [Mycobacterium sp.]|nr:hypothetical protein [Mycobacterium sp.]
MTGSGPTSVRGATWRFAVFTVVALTAGVVIWNTLRPGVAAHRTYSAVFTDLSGLRTGDAVRIAGIRVGSVTGERLVAGNLARVTFAVADDQQLTAGETATVRYANLLGQRYLALGRGPVGAARLAPGSVIPVDRTAPALDLTALFNGFRPLFAALDPQQINQLSTSIVQVLQGEGATIGDLFSQTALVTGDLAQRSAAIRQVIGNVSTLLTTVADHDDGLARLLDDLTAFSRQLGSDSPAIGASLAGVDGLAASVAGLLDRAQHGQLAADLTATAGIAGTLAQQQASLDHAVAGLPALVGSFARTLDAGSWLKGYVCAFTLRTTGAGLAVTAADLAKIAGNNPALVALLGLVPGQVPVPVSIPNGTVGRATAHTAACPT